MEISYLELKYGDVLITTSNNAVSHCGIVAGKREVKMGSGIYAPTEDRTDMVVHATSGGVLTQEAQKWRVDRGRTDVFRFRSTRFSSIGGKSAA